MNNTCFSFKVSEKFLRYKFRLYSKSQEKEFKLTPAKADIRQVFVVVYEHWSNEQRVHIQCFSKEPVVIGQDTVLHHNLGYSAASGRLKGEGDKNVASH